MEIIILGIRGMGLDIVDAIEAQAARGAEARMLGFLDDEPSAQGAMVGGYPVLGRVADAARMDGACFINGVGSPTSYRQKPSIIGAAGIADDSRWVAVVHPSSVVSPSATIGAGTAVLSLCSVAAGAKVGRHVMVLPNSVISHETVVCDFVTIASGVCIAGRCTIGSGAYIGSNACIRQGIRIGENALVGMGAVVVDDVPDHAVVMGNPARRHGETSTSKR